MPVKFVKGINVVRKDKAYIPNNRRNILNTLRKFGNHQAKTFAKKERSKF